MNSLKSLLLFAISLSTQLFAEPKQKESDGTIIKPDKVSEAVILSANDKVIKVKFTNKNSFPVTAYLLAGVIERKTKNSWENMRLCFRDCRTFDPALPHTQTVEAGKTVTLDFRPSYTDEFREWKKGDSIRFTFIYERSSAENSPDSKRDEKRRAVQTKPFKTK